MKSSKIQSLRSKIKGGDVKAARREALRYLHGEHKEEIIEMFRTAEIPTFQCPQCKRETERKFLPLFLMYDSNHKVCDQCNKNIVKAYEEQKLQDKMKALDKFMETFHAIVDQMIILAGVPDEFQNASISDLAESTQKVLSPHKSYFIKGSVGVGKSHMAVALMRSHLATIKPEYDEQRKGYYLHDCELLQPIFIEVPELLLEIRDSYKDKGTMSEKEIVDYYTMTPFLVLDDLGVEKASDFSTLMLYLIINRRCTQKKQTIITSNLNLEEIKERLSDRISSRIKGMCKEITVAGNDKRYERRQQRGNNGATATRNNTEHG